MSGAPENSLADLLASRPQRAELDFSDPKLGECQECGNRKWLTDHVCGGCHDDAYLGEMLAYVEALESKLRALAAAQAELHALREAMGRAEWGASRQGAPMGSMWHKTPGPMIPACPICRGVHPERGRVEFSPDVLGHSPDCPFATLGGQS